MEDSLAMKSSGKHIFEWLLHVLTFSHGWEEWAVSTSERFCLR